MEYRQNPKLKKFNELCNEIDRFYHEIANRYGLSDSGYEILKTLLVLGEGCTQTNIYRNSYLNKQTVNSSVRQLAKKGYIFFKQGKSRENAIYLTNEGKLLIEEKIIPVENAECEVFKEMTEAEYFELVRLTKKYLYTFQKKWEAIIEQEETQSEN